MSGYNEKRLVECIECNEFLDLDEKGFARYIASRYHELPNLTIAVDGDGAGRSNRDLVNYDLSNRDSLNPDYIGNTVGTVMFIGRETELAFLEHLKKIRFMDEPRVSGKCRPCPLPMRPVFFLDGARWTGSWLMPFLVAYHII